MGLDSMSANFCQDLEALDRLGNRTHDTLHVFYVRSGQKTAEEILSNVVSSLTEFGWVIPIFLSVNVTFTFTFAFFLVTITLDTVFIGFT